MSEVSSNLEVLFNKMENFVSTKTVIGDPITIGKVILVPLIDVSFGVGAGAKQNKANKVGSDTKKWFSSRFRCKDVAICYSSNK